MTVDFHVHSNASDGTFAPAELAEKARGFAALTLSDHDNMDGVAECQAACERLGVPFVPAVELSIDPGAGFDRFHMLCLGVDRENAALKDFLRRILEGRNARNKVILENFARIGIDIPADDIATYAHGAVLARPHFARWLMVHGYVQSVREGVETYLQPNSPEATNCYEDRWHPPQDEAFRIVHDAGGLCFMAHPRYWRRTWKVSGVEYGDAERELSRLKEAGLDGVEALYNANTPEENVEFVRMADRLGFLKSAGSDFHGQNKPTIPLGMEVDEAYIAPLLERLRIV